MHTMGTKKFEKPTPGNPYQLTIKQHIHASGCIQRFASKAGLVSVRLKKQEKTIDVDSRNDLFCTRRTWAQRLEHLRGPNGAVYPGFFTQIEHRFLDECDRIKHSGRITSHRAISEYLSIWQMRAQYAHQSREDTRLSGISGSNLTKIQEERLEAKGVSFVRDDGTVPSRLTLGMLAIRDFDMSMHRIGDMTWGIIRVLGNNGFLCPDTPANIACIPIDRSMMLCGWRRDMVIGDAMCHAVNHSFLKQSIDFVFGHPMDMAAFVGDARSSLIDLGVNAH